MTRLSDDLERRRDFVFAVGLFVLAAVVYLPAVRYGFVNWDDPAYVLRNSTIKSWTPTNLYRIATTAQVREFAPLTMFSFLVDHTLWGGWAGGYHLTNVWLHAVNAVFVFLIVRQLGAGRFVAATTAALFAVHPVQVESVVWISARGGLLSATFILASLHCWLRWFRTVQDEAWGILWLFLALACNANAVVVPAIVLLFDLWIRRDRLSLALPRQIVPVFLAVCLLSMSSRISSPTVALGGTTASDEFGIAYRVALDGPLLWRYVAHLAFPFGLSVLYDTPNSGRVVGIVLAWMAWFGVGVLAFLWRDRFAWLRFGLVASLLLLVPVLNVSPNPAAMNDRYLYLPVIPFLALALGGLEMGLRSVVRDAAETSSRRLTWSRLLRGVAFATIAGAGLVNAAALTKSYMQVWRNDLVLWQHARERTPELLVVRIQLAMALRSRGFEEESVAELERTLVELSPDAADERRIRSKLDEWRTNPSPG